MTVFVNEVDDEVQGGICLTLTVDEAIRLRDELDTILGAQVYALGSGKAKK